MKLTMPHKAPTMIIPQGTDIQVDDHGQLSIRTPGNLVIQNSGHYSTIESTGGSIRIESDADVEAVNVRCAETCFVAGHLTAWKVEAKAVHLEDTARANIVLQETERMQIGSDARLTGNFGSEKELFLLLSRFAHELKALPLFSERKGGAGELAIETTPEYLLAGGGEHLVEDDSGSIAVTRPGAGAHELPDPLFFSLVILEREFGRPGYGPSSRRVIEELIKLLRERDLDTLGLTYRTLCGRIVEPGKDVQRVFELIQGYFQNER